MEKNSHSLFAARVLRPAAGLLIAAALFGCSTTEHKIASRSYGRSPGTYMAPEGWVVVKVTGPARTENSLKQKTARNDDAPAITIDASTDFDRRFPHSQKGCADGFLDGIHDVYDETTQSEAMEVVENPVHGKVQIYRFHSKWYGDHLVAFVVTKSGFATLELWASNTRERKAHTVAFHEFVRSVRLK